ncbi:MAG: nucleotidyltransferase domain-containing protein [Ardenticatenia bacterium]|nr:nucleotidyltransferase domain-containing protein [Ardenticatenia bacterium]
MARMALDLTPEEVAQYRRAARLRREQEQQRNWPGEGSRAWEVARAAARLLREEFGATRVVAFGSLVHRAWFTPWSDIDLAAWGIPPDAFYRAVALVTGLSPEFEIDLVAPEDCRPALHQIIEREGVDL